MRWLSIVLFVVAVVAGAAFFLQRQAASVLRAEIALVREEVRHLPRLRAEHERLEAARISEAELQRLRADRAAVVRLRAEINELKKRAEEMERDAVHERATERTVTPAAETLDLRFAADGSLSLSGNPIDLASLRQRWGALPRGARVMIRVHFPTGRKMEHGVAARALQGISATAKESGLRFELRLVQPGQPGG